MNHPLWIIHPSVEEIETVQRFASIAQPEETDGTGVWVVYDGLQRVWTGAANRTTWEVRGGLAVEPQQALHLPARVLYEASCIARDEDVDALTLLVPSEGGVVIVQSSRTQTVIDLHDTPPAPPESPVSPDRTSAARAQVEAGVLADLLRRTYAVPATGTSDVFPTPILIIGDGAISVYVDWSVRGARRSTYRCEAVTVGEARRIAPLRQLEQTMSNADRDMIVEIDLPDDPFGPIVVHEPGAWSTYPSEPADARRYADDVLDVLVEMFGEDTEVIEPGSYGIELDDCRFTVQLLDAPDAIVRVATAVCDFDGGDESDPELLRHLNEVNAGLVAGRLWIDGHRVWGAIDLPVRDYGSIGWAIEKLRTQLDGFDVFLGAIVNEVTR